MDSIPSLSSLPWLIVHQVKPDDLDSVGQPVEGKLYATFWGLQAAFKVWDGVTDAPLTIQISACFHIPLDIPTPTNLFIPLYPLLSPDAFPGNAGLRMGPLQRGPQRCPGGTSHTSNHRACYRSYSRSYSRW